MSSPFTARPRVELIGGPYDGARGQRRVVVWPDGQCTARLESAHDNYWCLYRGEAPFMVTGCVAVVWKLYFIDYMPVTLHPAEGLHDADPGTTPQLEPGEA